MDEAQERVEAGLAAPPEGPTGTGAVVRAGSRVTSAFAPGSSDRRLSWQGFGDGMSQAFDIALTPVLFALLGLVVDSRLGTRPAFAISLAVFAMVGVFVKTWFHYSARMEALEREKTWQRGARP